MGPCDASLTNHSVENDTANGQEFRISMPVGWLRFDEKGNAFFGQLPEEGERGIDVVAEGSPRHFG